MKKNVLIILLSIFALSCDTDDDNQEIENIESSLIIQSNLAGAGEEGISKQNLIITDETVWNNLITQVNTVNNESDRFSETDIDFSEYTIIAAFDQVQANGGHSIELDITANSDNIIVKVTNTAPAPLENVITVVTQPYHIVKITNSELPIIFE